MAERKVLTKYYPPDFDPSKIVRSRVPKSAGPKLIPVRLMAPFSMKCTTCGEYVYKGRKFNARKETTNEKYYAIPIYRFYIRCTRCSAEITFKTDPKNMDYTCEKGAKRNFEVWRAAQSEIEETEDQRLDRLEAEEEEQNAMVELETKTLDAKREMAIADALDEIRTRNARNERGEVVANVAGAKDDRSEARERAEREDDDAARRAFMRRVDDSVELMEDESPPEPASSTDPIDVPAAVPSFKRVVKKKKDHSAALGIKRKPGLV